MSIFLLAAGAIMTFAVAQDEVSGISIDTVGIILMIVGAIGLLASMLFWSSFSPYARGGRSGRGTVVTEERIL